MIARFLKWLRREKAPTFRFVAYPGNCSVATPVVSSARIKPKWLRKQTGEAKFTDCPGMLDYSHAGYIITAHADIHIKANSEGVVIEVQGMHIEPHEAARSNPAQFNYSIVEGMIEPVDVERSAWKIPLPWGVFAEKGFSGYLMPAIMHADYLDKIFVFPGIIDFDKFHTINFVFSPLKECEFIIPAGTPLLQVLPMRRDEITAECGKATERDVDEMTFNMASRLPRYYRKFLSQRKVFKMTCPYDHRGDK